MGEMCIFPKKIEWLGFKISKLGVKPLVGKSDSIKNLPNPKNISELRSFFGSINQYMKFVRPEFVFPKFSPTTTSRKEISLPME